MTDILSINIKDTEYISIDGTVSPGPLLPLKIYQHTISSINKTHSILIGGLGGDYIDNTSNKTWFYNHTLKNWTSGPILMVGRSLHTAGIVRDKLTNEDTIVVVGGMGTTGTILDSVEVLNLKSGHTWRKGCNDVLLTKLESK